MRMPSRIDVTNLAEQIQCNDTIPLTETELWVYAQCSALLDDFYSVLFSLWVRLLILSGGIYDVRITENIYRKIEHYFDEVINEIRVYLPQLF